LIVLFAFTGASATAPSFLLPALFYLALIAFLFLDTPKEPFERFPFADFLSPLPIDNVVVYGAMIRKGLKFTKS
jgi:hypothetical protein